MNYKSLIKILLQVGKDCVIILINEGVLKYCFCAFFRGNGNRSRVGIALNYAKFFRKG